MKLKPQVESNIALVGSLIRYVYFACAISYFDFSLPADGKCKSFFAITPGYVITSVFVIGVGLLGRTSFEFDTVQLNG